MASVLFHGKDKGVCTGADSSGSRVATVNGLEVAMFSVCPVRRTATALWTTTALLHGTIIREICTFAVSTEPEDVVYLIAWESSATSPLFIATEEGFRVASAGCWRVTSSGWVRMCTVAYYSNTSVHPSRCGVFLADGHTGHIRHVPFNDTGPTYESRVKFEGQSRFIGDMCRFDANTNTFLWVACSAHAKTVEIIRTSLSGDVIASVTTLGMAPDALVDSGPEPTTAGESRALQLACHGLWATATGFECFMVATPFIMDRRSCAASRILVLSASLKALGWREAWVAATQEYQAFTRCWNLCVGDIGLCASESWLLHSGRSMSRVFGGCGITFSPEAVRKASMSAHRVGWMVGVARAILAKFPRAATAGGQRVAESWAL